MVRSAYTLERADRDRGRRRRGQGACRLQMRRAMAGGVEVVEWEMEGEALRVRRLSRRLLFFDLLLSRPPLFLTPLRSPLPAGAPGEGSPCALSGEGGGPHPVLSALEEGSAVGEGPPALLGGAGSGAARGAAIVEVVLRGPTGREDVRAQGREVRQGAVLRVRGSAIEWRLRGPGEGQGEEGAGGAQEGESTQHSTVQEAKGAYGPAIASPAAARCCEFAAIASHVTRLVPLHSAEPAQSLTPPAAGSNRAAGAPPPAGGGAPVLVPRHRPQEWNTLACLPQNTEVQTNSSIATVDVRAPGLRADIGEGASGPREGVPGGSPGHAREGEQEWELMAPPGRGYALDPARTAQDSGHDEAVHSNTACNDFGHSDIVYSDTGRGATVHRNAEHSDTIHTDSRGQGGPCGRDPERGVLQGVCRGWLNTGQCPAADAGLCAHRHPPPGELSALRQGWVSARLSRRAELRSVDPFDPLHEGLKEGRQGRARVFAAWLVRLMGAERLSAGRGVLDIAGGRGPLSFALAAIHGVPCTLVDPRPPKVSREAKQLRKEGKRLRKLARARDRGSAEEGVPVGAVAVTPLVLAIDQSDGVPPGHSDSLPTGQSDGVPPGHSDSVPTGQSDGVPTDHSEGVPSGHNDSVPADHSDAVPTGRGDGASTDRMRCIQGEFYACERKWQEHARAHSCLVGLHPDQATGDIVFAAVAHRRPFAVVPCCVFPGRFARRRLRRTGQHVQSPEELCQYLMEMCRAGGGVARRSWLPFKGCNAVVYCTEYESQ